MTTMINHATMVDILPGKPLKAGSKVGDHENILGEGVLLSAEVL